MNLLFRKVLLMFVFFSESELHLVHTGPVGGERVITIERPIGWK